MADTGELISPREQVWSNYLINTFITFNNNNNNSEAVQHKNKEGMVEDWHLKL